MELNQLHNQDCIAGMEALKEGSIDLAFADPPFNIGYEYDVYHDLSSAFRDGDRLEACAERNRSLRLFVGSLTPPSSTMPDPSPCAST